ncbi:MAG: hypothetical protein WD036_11320 [Bauldia sp.]
MSPTAKPSAGPPPRAEPEPSAGSEPESIENSILAAIAEAVDVLVEDRGGSSGGKERRPPQAARRRQSGHPPADSKAKQKPRVQPQSDEKAGDIGDEIQRIIANYNRNRKEGRDA